MIYDVIRKSDGTKLYEYQADAPVEWDGMAFADFDHVERLGEVVTPSMPTKFAGRRILTKREFRSLFPESALKAIDRFEVQFEQAGFLTDDQKDTIRTGFNDYHAAENIDLDDEELGPGLGLYVGLGFMTANEVSEVLNG